jgi:hypothetical protein
LVSVSSHLSAAFLIVFFLLLRCVELALCRVVEVPDSEALVNCFDVVDAAKEATTRDSEKSRTRFCAHSREVGEGGREGAHLPTA